MRGSGRTCLWSANFPCRTLDLQQMGALIKVNRPLEISQLGQLSLSSSLGRQVSSKLQLDFRHLNRCGRHLVNAYEVKTQAWQNIGSRGWLKNSPALWLPVHQGQLRAQRSVKSMKNFTFLVPITGRETKKRVWKRCPSVTRQIVLFLLIVA